MKNRLEYILNALYYSEWKIWSDMAIKGTKTIFYLYDIPDARQNGTGPLKMPGTIVTGGTVFLNTYL